MREDGSESRVNNSRPSITLGPLNSRVESATDRVDPEGFLRSIVDVGLDAAKKPAGTAGALFKFMAGTAAASAATAGKALGADVADPGHLAKDRRFSDPAWDNVPIYYMLRRFYGLHHELYADLIENASMEPAAKRKAAFAGELLLDALSPTNTLIGNPAALRRARQTKGKSLAAGAKNFVDDVRFNGGRPRQVDTSAFEVGKNMGMTPGKVVYRTELIELIEYAPSTEQVYEIPLLFCPPWINKYYIMDLAPEKSLIQWARDHGHRCFVISYRNPDETMSHLTLEDYLLSGPLDASRVVREITGAKKVNSLSVCMGGTLTAMAMAYETKLGKAHFNTGTFINTHVDFTIPGMLESFVDEDVVNSLERRMAKKGYLDGADMGKTFDSLRANDLIFQYVAKNWLMGEPPPAFDLLAWNADATRMPAQMHTTYLRNCFLDNKFSKGEYDFSGIVIDPRDVEADAFVISAVGDHIVPWHSGYRTAKLLGGDNTFVLCTAGHIAGIVSPPSPKTKHWANSDLPEDPEEWRENAEVRDESWWPAWSRWLATRAGKEVEAPTTFGSKKYPPICDAPGTYVFTKS